MAGDYATASLRALLISAERRGWAVEHRHSGHLRLTHPAGGLVFTSSTPSDWRATYKIAAELKRQERRFEVPW